MTCCFSGGSNKILSDSTSVATPFLRIVLPHPSLGQSKSNLLLCAPSSEEPSTATSCTPPAVKADNNFGAGRSPDLKDCWRRVSRSTRERKSLRRGGSILFTTGDTTFRISYQGRGPCTTALSPMNSNPAFSYKGRSSSWVMRRIRWYGAPCICATSSLEIYSRSKPRAIPLCRWSGETQTE